MSNKTAVGKDGKTYNQDEIRNLLLTRDDAVVRALEVIYKYQTEHEKVVESTLEHNNVGFNGPDGKILSSMAKFYNKNKFLTPKQIAFTRKRIVKYSGQIIKIMNRVQ